MYGLAGEEGPRGTRGIGLTIGKRRRRSESKRGRLRTKRKEELAREGWMSTIAVVAVEIRALELKMRAALLLFLRRSFFFFGFYLYTYMCKYFVWMVRKVKKGNEEKV